MHVRESDAKPMQCGDDFFWRQGAVTQKLNRNEIRDFFRAERVIQFDRSPCPGFRYPDDFDRAKFDTWLGYSGITGQPSVKDVLVNIEAAERAGKKLLFRNAGVLFFAKNVRRFFPHAYITCLLARDTDKVHILDRKDFSGGIVADIEDALRFRKTYLQPALDAGLIEMTLPDKSHSRRQRYRLTPTGSAHRQRPQKGELTSQVTPSVTPQDTPRAAPPETPQDRLLWAMEGEMTGQELRQKLALKDTKHFRKTYLQPALDAGLIEMTLPDKPHSRRQRYRLTPTGSAQRQRPATTKS